MFGTIRASKIDSSKIEGRFCRRPNKPDGGGRFTVVAKALWPVKTAANLAAIAGKDERTASRWLSGKFEPPPIVFAAILNEITKRD